MTTSGIKPYELSTKTSSLLIPVSCILFAMVIKINQIGGIDMKELERIIDKLVYVRESVFTEEDQIADDGYDLSSYFAACPFEVLGGLELKLKRQHKRLAELRQALGWNEVSDFVWSKPRIHTEGKKTDDLIIETLQAYKSSADESPYETLCRLVAETAANQQEIATLTTDVEMCQQKNLTPKRMSGEWYIECTTEEFGAVLLCDPDCSGLAVLSFPCHKDALAFIRERGPHQTTY